MYHNISLVAIVQEFPITSQVFLLLAPIILLIVISILTECVTGSFLFLSQVRPTLS